MPPAPPDVSKDIGRRLQRHAFGRSRTHRPINIRHPVRRRSGADAEALDCRPTAIFAVNDNTAIGALSALNKMGLSVPDDISLIGYNDIPIVSHLSTPLTTLRVPFDQIASHALELLTQTTAPRENRILVSAPTLIPRKSTARFWEHPT